MRIGIVSDTHCDARALQIALEDMQPVDRVLCAGDLVLQYRFSNEVLDIIRDRSVSAVQGNHEEAILSSAGAALRASGAIRPDNLTFVENLPAVLEMEIEGKRIMMMHTSPLDPTGGGRALRDGLGPYAASSHIGGHTDGLPESKADVLIVGHTHQALITQVGRTLLINPGSLGQPRDPDHPHLRTYAVLDTSTSHAYIGSFHMPLRE